MSRMTANWDAIIASAPHNKTAGVVASKGDGGFVARKQIRDEKFARQDAPFKTKPFCPNSPGAFDLTGMVFGRLTVVGYDSVQTKGAHGRWIVRCVCGWYEKRKKKALVDGSAVSCSECNYTSRLREGRAGVEFPKITVGARK